MCAICKASWIDWLITCGFLERQWNMWIPGFGSDEIRPYKKACTTEAHKQVRYWTRHSLSELLAVCY